MTAPHTATATPTIAVVMFTLAGLGTAAAIPHAILGAIDDWPPQPMTLHAVAIVGFLLVGLYFKTRPPTADVDHPEASSLVEPARHQRKPENQFDDVTVGFAELDRRELDELERRLRDTDW